jgi:membrane-bound metal-dependent hydrolase YbcI (DUF457 family)
VLENNQTFTPGSKSIHLFKTGKLVGECFLIYLVPDIYCDWFYKTMRASVSSIAEVFYILKIPLLASLPSQDRV